MELFIWVKWLEHAKMLETAFNFDNYEDSTYYLSLVIKIGEMHHCWVHRKKGLPILYYRQMLRDTIDIMRMMGDQRGIGMLSDISKNAGSLATILMGRLSEEDKLLEMERLRQNQLVQAELLLEYERLRTEETDSKERIAGGF